MNRKRKRKGTEMPKRNRFTAWVLPGALALVIGVVILTVTLFFVYPLLSLFWYTATFLGLVVGICWIAEGLREVHRGRQRARWYKTTSILTGIEMLAIALLFLYLEAYLLTHSLDSIHSRSAIDLPFFISMVLAFLAILSLVSLIRQKPLFDRERSRGIPSVLGHVGEALPPVSHENAAGGERSVPSSTNQTQRSPSQDRYGDIAVRIGLIGQMLLFLMLIVLAVFTPIPAPFSLGNWVLLALLSVPIVTSLLLFNAVRENTRSTMENR